VYAGGGTVAVVGGGAKWFWKCCAKGDWIWGCCDGGGEEGTLVWMGRPEKNCCCGDWMGGERAEGGGPEKPPMPGYGTPNGWPWSAVAAAASGLAAPSSGGGVFSLYWMASGAAGAAGLYARGTKAGAACGCSGGAGRELEEVEDRFVSLRAWIACDPWIEPEIDVPRECLTPACWYVESVMATFSKF
jgi:hypothetical protein